MPHWKLLAVLSIMTFTISPVQADALDERAAASQAAVQAFGTQLQGELMSAMQDEGPVQAIAVCRDRAPAIAADLSAETGWHIGRTSLKIRNPDNAPDDWERAVLEDFDAQRSAGVPAADLVHYEIVREGDEQVFRFMRAIPTAGLCLSCHGSTPVGDVKHALEQFYPDDQATGYSEGEVRGAFTVIQRM